MPVREVSIDEFLALKPPTQSSGPREVSPDFFLGMSDQQPSAPAPHVAVPQMAPEPPMSVPGIPDLSQPVQPFFAGDNPQVDIPAANQVAEEAIAQQQADEHSRNVYLENLKRAADWEQEARGDITGSSPFRIAESGLRSAADVVANPILAAVAALGSEQAEIDLANRQARSDMESLRDKSWIEAQVGGIVDSLSQTMTLAGTGGLPAILGGYGYQSYSQAYRDAKINGATDEEASKIARANAAMEVGIMTAFQVAGLGGLEKQIMRGPKWDGIKKALWQTAAELSEEELTTLGQNLASTGTLGDPQSYLDTLVQTLGAMGVVSGVQKAADAFMGGQQPEPEVAEAPTPPPIPPKRPKKLGGDKAYPQPQPPIEPLAIPTEKLETPIQDKAQQVAENINTLVENGTITPEQGQEMADTLNEAIATNRNTPDPLTQPEQGQEPPPVDNLRDMGKGMGGAISDNFYNRLEKSLIETDEVPSAESNTNVGKAWNILKGNVDPPVFVSALRAAQPETAEDWVKFVQSLQPEPQSVSVIHSEPESIEQAPEIESAPPEVQPTTPVVPPQTQLPKQLGGKPVVPETADIPKQETASEPESEGRQPWTADSLRNRLREIATTPEEGDAAFEIAKARAASAGMTVDKWADKRIRDLHRKATSKGDDIPDDTLAQPAYHGSPYRFDKFTLDKIGTGEGAQAYGWGLYFAGEKEVADYYHQKLTEEKGSPADRWLLDGEVIENSSLRSALDFTRYRGLDETIASLEKEAADRAGHEELAPYIYEGAANTLKKYRSRLSHNKRGAVYKVDLKPTDEELLHWDKPLSEQPESVKKILKKKFGYSSRILNDDILFGEDVYRRVGELRGGKKKASLSLSKAGIRGIKYLDGSSRGKGEGSYNYVIFDDADVVIEDILAQSDFRASVDKSTLAENRRGEVQLHKDGTATIRMFEDAQDASTLIHELAHVFLLDLPDADLATAEQWAGVTDGKWTRPAHEKFARGFERYLVDGQAPTPELKSVFEKFKKWLLEVYKAIKGSAIDIDISPEVRAVFDRMLTPKRLGGKPIKGTAPQIEKGPQELKPAEVSQGDRKPAEAEPPKSDIPKYVRSTTTDESIRTALQEEVAAARERERAIEDEIKPIQKQISGTRRNAYKKRGQLESQINELRKQQSVEIDQQRLRGYQLDEMLLEDRLENPKSIDHFLADYAEVMNVRSMLALAEINTRRRRGERPSQEEQQKQVQYSETASLYRKKLQDKAREIAEKDDRLNDDEIEWVSERAAADFTGGNQGGLADSVANKIKMSLEARAPLLPELSQITDEEREEYQRELKEAATGGPDWHKKTQAILDRALKVNKERKEKADAERLEQEKKQKKEAAEKDLAWQRERRAKAKEQSAEDRYWQSLAKRASPEVKGRKGETEVLVGEEGKKRKVKAKSLFVSDNFAITTYRDIEGDSKKLVSLTHVPTGQSVATGTEGQLKQLVLLMRDLGIDIDKALNPDGSLNSETKALVSGAYRAWENNSLETIPDESRSRLLSNIKAADTLTKADMVLDADDLGVSDTSKRLGFKGVEKIKAIADAAPEFAYEPIFTVSDNKKLLFKDGVTYTLEPEALGLTAGELTEGQTVGINLEDLGIKRLTAPQVVVETLKNYGFSKLTTKELPDTTSPGEAKPNVFRIKGKFGLHEVMVEGREKEWRVVSDAGNPAGKSATESLKKIHFYQEPAVKEKPAKKRAKPEVSQRDSGGEEVAGAVGNSRLSPLPNNTAGIPIKSQREIIADLAKGLNVPIRFGRLTTTKFAGYWKALQNLIGSKRANDVPTVSHEVGHKLDTMFKLSEDKAIRAELDVLGDPQTPGSRSSWTKSKTKKYKYGEGAAEFTRKWLTESDKLADLQADYPNTYAAFEQILNANKDVADVLRTAQRDIHTWRTASEEARLDSHIVIGGNPNRTRYTLDQLMRDTVDDLHILRLAVDDAKKSRKIAPSRDPYILARLLRGNYGMAETFLRRGIVDYKTKSVTPGTSLLDALKPVGGRLDEFRRWIVAVRAQELASQGRETGLNATDVDAVAKKYGSDKDFQDAFQKLKVWSDSFIRYAADAGMLTKESAHAMRQMNEDYVPFHRLFEIGAGESPSEETGASGRGLNLGKPGSLKRLKGSTRPIVDPLETYIKNAYLLITASEKAAVHNSLSEMANMPDMGRWIEEVRPPKEMVQFNVEEVRKQLEALGADMDNVDLDETLSFFRPTQQVPYGENIIRVIRGGEPKFYRLNPDLFDTFHALDMEDAGRLLTILSAPSQLLRAGATLDPQFMVRNFIRDTFGAAVLNKYGALPFEVTIRGMAAMLKKPNLVAEWMAAGGSSAVEPMYFDHQKMQEFMAKSVKNDLTPLERSMLILNSPLTALRWASGIVEEATRIGEYETAYKALIKSGMPDGDARRLAAFESRDRQDFLKGGAKTKGLRRLTPFWNAFVQGNVKVVETAKNNPVKFTAQGLAFITLPTLLLMAVNWDDEDYWAQPRWKRIGFWLIPIGKGADGHTKFLMPPKPFALGAIFGALPEAIMGHAREKDPEAAKEFMQSFLGENLGELFPAPHIPSVVAELTTGEQGYNWFRDRPIVPDSLVELPVEERWTEQTSALAKKVGEWLGVAPLKVDHLIHQTTGGLGKLGLGQREVFQGLTTSPLVFSNQVTDDFFSILEDLKHLKYRQEKNGEIPGTNAVHLHAFGKAEEKFYELRAKARDTADEKEAMGHAEEAYQLVKGVVERYRNDELDPKMVAEYSTKLAKTGVRHLGRPEEPDKRKFKDDAEYQQKLANYQERLAEWPERQAAAETWLREHIDTPGVRDAVREVMKDGFKKDRVKGESAAERNERIKKWREWRKIVPVD